MWEYNPSTGKYEWVPKTQFTKSSAKQFIRGNESSDIVDWVNNSFVKQDLQTQLDQTEDPTSREYIENYIADLDNKTSVDRFRPLTGEITPGFIAETPETEGYFNYLRKAEEKLGKPLFTTEDPYAVLAKTQTTGEQGLISVANLLPNIALGVVESVGYLGELPGAIIGYDRDFTNSLTEFAKQGKGMFGEVYRDQPNEVFDLSDPAWWFQNGSGLVESIGQFAITGFGVGSALGKSGRFLAGALKLGEKGTKLGIGAAKTVGQLAPQALTSATLAYTEGAMSGAEVYKEVYEDFVNKTGDVEYAKQQAASAASKTVGLNTLLNSALNMYSLAPIFKSANSLRYTGSMGFKKGIGETTEQYLKRLNSLPAEYAPSLKRTMGKYGLEAPMESIEEAVNVFAEREGRIEGGLEEDKRGVIDRFMTAAFSDEGKLSMALGAVGGIGNIAAVDNLPSFKKADNKLGFTLGPGARQQEVEQKKKQYAGALFSLKQDLTDFTTENENLKKAVESGDVNKIEEAKEKLFNISARRSIVDGVGEYLVGTLEEVKNVDNTNATLGPDGKTDAMRQGLAQSMMDNDYKTKADEKIEEIKTLQQKFDQHFFAYNAKDVESPGYLKYLFSAFVDSHSAKKVYDKEIDNFRKAQMDLNSLKMSMQDIILAENEEEKIEKIKNFEKQLEKSPEYISFTDAKKRVEESQKAFNDANTKYEEALDFELYKKKVNGFVEENTKAAEEKAAKDTDTEITIEELSTQLRDAGYSPDPKSQGIGRTFAFEMKVKDEATGEMVEKSLIAERIKDPKTGAIKILVKDADTAVYLKDAKGNNVEFNLDYFKANKNKISIIPMAAHMEKRKAKLLRRRRLTQIEALKAVSQDFQNEVNSLNRQIKEAEESIENANKEIEELQNDLSKHIKDRTHKLNKKEINRRIKELNKTINKLKEIVPQLESTRDAIFPKLEALRVLQEEVSLIPEDEQIAIEDTITDIAEVIKTQLTPVSETLEDLEKMLSSMEDGILTMREEIEKLEALVAEIEDLLKDSEYISALQGRAIMEATFRGKYPGFPIPVKGLYDALEFNKNREAVTAYLGRLARQQGKSYEEVREEFTDHLMAYDEAELKANERFALDADLKVANSKLIEARKALKEHLDTYVTKSEERNNLLKLKLIADNLQSEIGTIARKEQMISIRDAISERVKASQLTSEPEAAVPSESKQFRAIDTFLSSNLFYTTGLNVEYETNDKGEIIGTKYDDNGNPVIKPGYQKGWFAFLDKFTSLFKKEKSPYKLKLFVRTDPNTPANLKALMDKEVGDKGSDLDVGAFLVDDKGNFITINSKGEFDADGYPAFTFLPKLETLLSISSPRVNWDGLTNFYMQSNPGVGSVPSIKNKKDDAEVTVGGKKITVEEFKKMLVDNARENYSKFLDKVKANQAKGVFVDIDTVSNGISLKALDENKKQKFQDLKTLLKERKAKVKNIYVAKGEDGSVVINSTKYFYSPGTTIVELEDGTFFPVFTSPLSDEDIQTTLYLIYTGRSDFNASINLPEKNFTLGGAKSMRIFPKNQSNRFSLLANLINWGKVDYKSPLPSETAKFEIYIQSGKVFFKNPENNYAPTFINVEDVMDPSKNRALVALLAQKRYNVSAAALKGGKYMYFHPKYNPKTGQFTFQKYEDYTEYLLSKLKTFTFVTPDGQMMASKNIVLKTDNSGMPIISSSPTITEEEVEPDYPEMPDFSSDFEDATGYESFFSDMSDEEIEAFAATPEKLATASKLFEQTEEEETPTEVKTITPTTAAPVVSDKKTPIEGLNERLEGYGSAKVVLPSDFYEGERPKGRLNAFKSAITKVADNLIVLGDLNLSEFDFLTSEDKARLDALRPLAEELRILNMNDISLDNRRTVAVEKRFAALTNQLANEFVDIVGKHVEQQLDKAITSSKPKLAVLETPAPVSDKKAEIEKRREAEISKIENPSRLANQLKIEAINAKYDAELAALEETKPAEVISDKDYNEFIDNNKVSDSILNTIANKVINKESLSPREQAIFSGKTSEVENIIKNLTPTTPITSLEWDALSDDVKSKLEKMDINGSTWDYLNDEDKIEYINNCLK